MSYRLGVGNYVPTIPCATARSGLPPALLGLGCANCNGSCGCHKGLLGLGIFDTGLDFSGWGITEWAIVALGGYMLFSTFSPATMRRRSVERRTGRALKKVRMT